MSRLSWKKSKTGKYGKETYELRKGGETLAIVQQVETFLWFSYGLKGQHWNTCHNPTGRLEAMKDAVARYKNAVAAEATKPPSAPK